MNTARRNAFFAALRAAALVLAAVATAACGPSRRTNFATDGGVSGGSCPAACKGTCNEAGLCNDCPAGSTGVCNGNTVVSCNADGTVGATLKTCDAGYQCVAGNCMSACDVAASSHSYIGCDYWPTTTLTSQLNPYFDFAVAVANPARPGDVTQGLSADITITRDGQTIETRRVAPGAVETINLPWVQALTLQPTCAVGGNCSSVDEKSSRVKGGAYHLVSSIPVTVYQFSPLQFEKPVSSKCVDPPYKTCISNKDCDNGDTCAFDANVGARVCADRKNCHSYTNDASILLPTTALKNDYVVISRQTFSNSDGFSNFALPGFTAIVATDNDTEVMVVSSAFTEAGTGVAALSPGASQTYVLQQGDVLQLVSKRASSPCAATSSDASNDYCDLGPRYDLTGTRVTANKPIAVFGGHSCSFVPYNKWACDHLEEQLTPVDTWGQKVVVAQTNPATKGEPNVFRVVSGSDNNTITFDPPSVHKEMTLSTGGYFEFVANGAFAVSSTGRVAVGQYMVGENYVDNAKISVGDPSLGLGVPVEQYRSEYDFLSPSTYTKNDLTLIAPMSATFTLDGVDVPNQLQAIGGTGYGYQYVALTSGAHHVSGSSAFGITVSGTGNFTSYLFVGGQNLNDVPLQ